MMVQPHPSTEEREMTYEEYRRLWDMASPEQRDWVKAKARWEAMSLWAVVNEWGMPSHEDACRFLPSTHSPRSER